MLQSDFSGLTVFGCIDSDQHLFAENEFATTNSCIESRSINFGQVGEKNDLEVLIGAFRNSSLVGSNTYVGAA